jgi:hypothetical protein
VAKLVTPPDHSPRERETWSKAEVKKFLAKACSDRLYAAWRLSLYGLRRGGRAGLALVRYRPAGWVTGC